MRDHIVIINAPGTDAVTHLRRLLTQLRQEHEYASMAALLLAPSFPDGLPDELRDLGLVHYTGHPNNSADLQAADVRWAADIIILAEDETDPHSDTMNFDVLHRIRELHSGAQIIVEVVDDANRERFLASGAMVAMRPVRAYPEMLLRSMTAPGTEAVLEDLFTPGGSLVRRYDLRVHQRRWGDIAAAVLKAGHGIALAYVDANAEVVVNPPPDMVADGYGLIVAARADSVASRTELVDLLLSLPVPRLAP